MDGVILYQSKYGAAKKYADWLAEETGYPCMETKKADIKEIEKYDTIILGGGIYASGIAGLSFLKRNIGKLTGKKILVFCCGASPYEESAFQQCREHNMKDMLSDIPVFYCRGAWDMDAMSLPADYEVWEKALMAAGEDKCDWTDKKYIEPIIAYLGK